jgi:hypothetical protein
MFSSTFSKENIYMYSPTWCNIYDLFFSVAIFQIRGKFDKKLCVYLYSNVGVLIKKENEFKIILGRIQNGGQGRESEILSSVT